MFIAGGTNDDFNAIEIEIFGVEWSGYTFYIVWSIYTFEIILKNLILIFQQNI
jgi:hypothetical protein